LITFKRKEEFLGQDLQQSIKTMKLDGH